MARPGLSRPNEVAFSQRPSHHTNSQALLVLDAKACIFDIEKGRVNPSSIDELVAVAKREGLQEGSARACSVSANKKTNK